MLHESRRRCVPLQQLDQPLPGDFGLRRIHQRATDPVESVADHADVGDEKREVAYGKGTVLQ